MTVDNRGSHRSKNPRRSPLTEAGDFARLANDLDAIQDVGQVLAQILEFAAARMDCARATIQLSPTGRRSITTTTSPPRLTVAPDPSQPNEIATRLTVDLSDGKSSVGTIAFYPAQASGFAPYDVTTAYLIAVHASLAIAAIRSAENLAAAVEAHTIIGQALGIVMERYALDADAALAMLRYNSQDNDVRLQDIARSLVTTRRLPREQRISAPRKEP